MKELSMACEKLFAAAARHRDAERYLVDPDPLGFAEERNHVFQFDIGDGKPFHLDIGNKEIRTSEGVSPLDPYGKDWNKVSLIWTETATLRDVLRGEKEPIEEWHRGRWDFVSRIGNSPYHSWFCLLLEMGREQLGRELVSACLSREKTAAAAMGRLLAAIKGHPEGPRTLVEPGIAREFDGGAWEHTFQFEPEGDGPFCVEIKQGDIKTAEGATHLDWRVKDWAICTRIWTAEGVLPEVIRGEKNLVLEWHEGRADFSSRIANSCFHSWLCIILRLAREQLAKDLLSENL